MTAFMKTTDKYGGTGRVPVPTPSRRAADDGADRRDQGRRLPAQARAVRRHGRRRLHRQLGGRARAPGPVAAVVGHRRPRLRARRRAGHPGRLAGARRVRRPAVGLAGGPAEPRPRRPLGRRRQRPRRRARRLQEPVGLPARAADLAVRRRAVPGLQLHADVGRDDRAPGVRDRDLRLDAAHAAGRPGGRHRPQRPQPGPLARVRRDAADRVPPAGPAQGPAREGLRRGHPGRVREDPARAPPAEGLPRRPRDLPRRLLPGQPRQGDPGGLLRHRPPRAAAFRLRGRLVAGVGGRRLRDGVRRRHPHPDDVGVPAGRRAAAGEGPARRADPARRRPGRHAGPGRERGAVRVPEPRARRQPAARAARGHAARRQPGARRPDPDPDPRDLPRRPTTGGVPDRGPGDLPVRPRDACSRCHPGRR